jgi:hypothetical protein
MLCPNCENKLEDNPNFCFKCGTLADKRDKFCLSCGNKLEDNPNFCFKCRAFIDPRDSKPYRWVEIGKIIKRVWMAENLNYEAEGSKCGTYGRLYNWEAANRVCPPGWHLPSKKEWDVLIMEVGDLSTAGTKLKAKNGWSNGGNGTDDYGFLGYPKSHV